MPEIVRATRVQLNFWKDLSWAMTVRQAREWLTVHAASDEVEEGLMSFRQKRPVDYERLRADIENAGGPPEVAEIKGTAGPTPMVETAPRIKVDPTNDAGVAVVWLNRPEVLNALDYATLGELVDALEALDVDPAVRCVVITGAGERAFAAGADIKEMADATPVSLSVANNFARWERLKRVRVPLIAAVRGFRTGRRLRAGDGVRHRSLPRTMRSLASPRSRSASCPAPAVRSD